MDAFTALHLYRMKDVVEKAFGNIKERLNMRRLLVSSEKGLEGKIFTEFAALILDYYGAAEPPVQCGESHLSGPTEPLLMFIN